MVYFRPAVLTFAELAQNNISDLKVKIVKVDYNPIKLLSRTYVKYSINRLESSLLNR
jgi:hypothetical protein